MEERTDPAAVVELSVATSNDWIEENQLPDSEVLIFPDFPRTPTSTRKFRRCIGGSCPREKDLEGT